jgi:hypothetical protein
MHTVSQGRLPPGTLLLDGVRVLGRGLPVFLGIAGVSAVLIYSVLAVVLLINLGSALAKVDPRVLTLTMTGREYAVLGAGLAAIIVLLSYSTGATVHAAGALASGERTGLMRALRRVRVKTLQLFWLQWVINVLAARYSPPAALVLWLFAAPSLPVGILENLGPGEAMDRTWALTRGNRIRLVILELMLLIPLLAMPAAIVVSPLNTLSPTGAHPLARLALAIPILTILLVPYQYLLTVLTLAYRTLEPGVLHAEPPASVNR